MTLRSMTGFGEASAGGLRAELRSVNNRGLDLRFRLPPGWQRLERRLAEQLRSAADRGSITLNISLDSVDAPVFDAAALQGRAALWAQVSAAVGRDEPVSIPWLLQGLEQAARPADAEQLSELVAAAVLEWDADRRREGAALAQQLIAAVAEMGTLVGVIAAAEEEAGAALRRRLDERIRELLGSHEVDEARLIQEVGLLAERGAIAEERIRLAAHLEACSQTLAGGGTVGRRLGFLAQEILREANTIGSKARALPIAAAVVELKALVEQLREQAANLE
jgi:uncharacterized protein (TIGR00255 family)